VSVSPFYSLFRTPGAALARFDPLPDEPLFRVIDPRTGARSVTPAGRPRWIRLALVWVAMTIPTLAFAWLQPSLGFNRLGTGKVIDRGALTDVDLYSMWVIWALYLVLIVLARRLVGSPLITVERTEVVTARDPGGWTLDPERRWLRALEVFTRLTPGRAAVWAILFLALNILVNVPGTLADGVQTWRSDPLTAGTWLSFFHRGTEQANLAGLWHLGIASALAGYLLLILCRLYVVFACIADAIARDPTISVRPTHPDGTGGLLPVGRASLFMALGVFASGLGLTAIALQGWATGQPMNAVFFLLCGLYLLIGPMLFVLPLTRLRRVMLDAKQRYLLEADHLYQVADARHAKHRSQLEVHADELQGMQALAEIFDRAADMTVWPFDRRTFRRFVALLVTPLLPLLKELPLVQDFIARLVGE
jgi:hypothetical protein